MGANGSPLFVLTWKELDMPSGVPICALRASARRTSGSDCGSWVSPTAEDHRRGTRPARPTDTGIPLSQQVATWPTPTANVYEAEPEVTAARRAFYKAKHINGNGFGLTTAQAAQLASWPTPCTQDGPNGGPSQGADRLPAAAALAAWPTPDTNTRGGPQSPQKRRAGGHSVTLQDAAFWPTPRANKRGFPDSHGHWATPTNRDFRSETATDEYNEKRWAHPRGKSLPAQTAAWATPRVTANGNHGSPRRAINHRARLEDQVHGTWATPTGRDHKDGASTLEHTPVNSLLGRQVLGTTLSGSSAATERRGQLNPAFARWLMGFPPEWDACAPTATPSSRK